MAMASIPLLSGTATTSLGSLTSYRVASSHQQAASQCLSCTCGALRIRDGFISGPGRSDSADAAVGSRKSSKERINVGRFGNMQQGQQQWQVGRVKVKAGLKDTGLTEQQWGPPIYLGTAQLPQDVDLKKLQTLLFQWGNSLTQNANLPLPVPLKVDKVEGGVRLGYIKVTDGKVEDLVHIDVLVTPASEGQPKPMFRAVRNGQLKNSVPPGEPLIMQSLLAALKKALAFARTSS